MNYTQLIKRALEKLEVTVAEVQNVNLWMQEGHMAILTTDFRKFVIKFSDLEQADEINQDTERPKRVKAVKK